MRKKNVRFGAEQDEESNRMVESNQASDHVILIMFLGLEDLTSGLNKNTREDVM